MGLVILALFGTKLDSLDGWSVAARRYFVIWTYRATEWLIMGSILSVSCDRATDKQTDRQTHRIAYYCPRPASSCASSCHSDGHFGSILSVS